MTEAKQTPAPQTVGHTAGPWQVLSESKQFCDTGEYDEFLAVSSGPNEDDVVCDFGIVEDNSAGEAKVANARLVAAAPELLEQVEDYYSFLNFLVGPTGPWLPSGIRLMIMEKIRTIEPLLNKIHQEATSST